MMCCTLSSTNRIGAKECAAHHGMAQELSSADGKAKNTMKRYTLSGATPIGANTCFDKFVSTKHHF
jgi:hypothetical protein